MQSFHQHEQKKRPKRFLKLIKNVHSFSQSLQSMEQKNCFVPGSDFILKQAMKIRLVLYSITEQREAIYSDVET